ERIAPTRRDEPLSRHTTIGIGGPADAFVSVEGTPQMVQVLSLCHESGTPVFMLGSGSNIVVGDRGMRGVTLEETAGALERVDGAISYERPFFRADAGASFAATARKLAFAG